MRALIFAACSFATAAFAQDSQPATQATSQPVMQATSQPTSAPVAAPTSQSIVQPTPPAAPTPPEARPKTESLVTAVQGKGLTVRSPDNQFAITLRARVQMRETITVNDEESTSEINIKTVRLVTQGHLLGPDLRYQVQFAFGPGDFDASTPTPLFDAWIEYRVSRDVQLRAGQYFVPFDRARTIREFSLQFVDRQLIIGELNLDRDVGVSASSQDLFGLDGKLNYSLGIFGGSGRNRVGGESLGFLYVGRVGVRPFGEFDDDSEGDLKRLATPRLALGGALAYNQNTLRARSTTGANYTLGGFDYLHLAADAVFKYKGLSLLSEVISRVASDDLHEQLNEDGTTTREFSRSGWGYLLQAGMMVSEKVELTARWNELFAREGTDPSLEALVSGQGKEVGAGVNLYFNGHALKVQADYATRFTDVIAFQVARLQLDVSF